MADLIITNGDAAGELLRRTLKGAEILPWRDVLYEGPVPDTDTLEDLTEVRVSHLAQAGGGDAQSIEFELTARDRGLGLSDAFERVVLWFEHDLYDQLQLLQILDWFARHPRDDEALFLVQAKTYIGCLEPEAIPDLAVSAEPVTQAQLELAQTAWAAFRQRAPDAWLSLRDKDLSVLPYLQSAVLRMLEELPGPDGLSRTERQILTVIDTGASVTALDVFIAVQKMEDAVFMGDWSFWRLLDGLALAKEPLIAGLEEAPFRRDSPDQAKAYVSSRVNLTSLGKAVLAGGADWSKHCPVDRWWGGTHLSDENLWRWDADRLIAPA